MTPEANTPIRIADKMRAVKVAWNRAPVGFSQDSAKKHYDAAERAHAVGNDDETHKALDAATHSCSCMI